MSLSALLTAVGLAMDASAVSITKGLCTTKNFTKEALLYAFTFGLCQGLMPFIGYHISSIGISYIQEFDHWISFGLLAFIGGKMLYESFKEPELSCAVSFDYKELIMLAIATSIDALVMGLSFALLKVDIVMICLLIGIVTFVLSFISFYIGKYLGSKFSKYAERVGGLVLIFIGVQTLFEHLS